MSHQSSVVIMHEAMPCPTKRRQRHALALGWIRSASIGIDLIDADRSMPIGSIGRHHGNLSPNTCSGIWWASRARNQPPCFQLPLLPHTVFGQRDYVLSLIPFQLSSPAGRRPSPVVVVPGHILRRVASMILQPTFPSDLIVDPLSGHCCTGGLQALVIQAIKPGRKSSTSLFRERVLAPLYITGISRGPVYAVFTASTASARFNSLQ